MKAWNAEQDAVKAYNDKWDAKTGTSQLALNAAIEETVAKRTAAEEAKADLIEAAIAYNEAAEQTAIYGSDIDAAFEGTPDATKGYHVKQTLDVTTLLSLNKESLKQVVIDRSNYLYGTSIYGSNAYGDPEARLIEITEEEIKAAIEAELEELGLYSYWTYISVLKNYGLIGETMAISEQLRIAKASLTNGEMIEAKIAEVEEALEALEAHYAEVEAAIEEKQEEFETADAKLKEDIDALQEPINAKLAEKYPLQKLIDAYANAIIDYKNAGETVLTQADIDYYVSICKTAVETAEDNVYKAETEMLWAREILAKWNKGDIERKEILEIKLENANAEVERATTGLNEIRAQLEAAIEALKWTAAE